MLAFPWNGVFAVLFIITCCLLVLVVLLQKGRGGGLGAAFGGAGSAAFGTRTGDVFTWITIVLTALFLLLAIGASFTYREPSGKLSPVAIIEESQEANVKHITLKSGDDKKKVKIYYTLDGSEPTEKSTPYASGDIIDMTAGQTIQARSFRYNWIPSDTASKVWEVPATSTAPASMPATTSAPVESAPAATTTPAVPAQAK